MFGSFSWLISMNESARTELTEDAGCWAGEDVVNLVSEDDDDDDDGRHVA